jgi:hypothetical protein
MDEIHNFSRICELSPLGEMAVIKYTIEGFNSSIETI